MNSIFTSPQNAPRRALTLEGRRGGPVQPEECSWDGPSMAPSSGEPYQCHDEGTMFHAGVGVHFCARHYYLFERDFGWQFKQHTGTTISELLDIVDEVERRVGL